MKVAMIGQKGMPAIYGGVERHVHELSVRLVKLGHKVVVYSRAWYSPNTEPIEGVQIKQIKTIHSKHLDAIIHVFLSTLDAIKQKADIIHYHGVGPSLLSWIPRIFAPKIKVVTTFHSMDRKHEKWNKFAKFILKLGELTSCRFAHTTIGVSKTLVQYCRDAYDTEAFFIPNGVPEYEMPNSDECLKTWNLENKKYLLVLSRLIPHKGIHYAIQAFNELQAEKSNLIEDLNLVIVGDGYYTEEYVNSLKQSAKKNEKIIFTGFQTGEALAELIANAKLMVHPSLNEGTPITVLEGMSYELPVLLSDIPEHLELIQNEHYLFEKGNVDSLKRKLAQILADNEEELSAEGEKNKQFVMKNYNWNEIAKKISLLYSIQDSRFQK